MARRRSDFGGPGLGELMLSGGVPAGDPERGREVEPAGRGGGGGGGRGLSLLVVVAVVGGLVVWAVDPWEGAGGGGGGTGDRGGELRPTRGGGGAPLIPWATLGEEEERTVAGEAVGRVDDDAVSGADAGVAGVRGPAIEAPAEPAPEIAAVEVAEREPAPRVGEGRVAVPAAPVPVVPPVVIDRPAVAGGGGPAGGAAPAVPRAVPVDDVLARTTPAGEVGEVGDLDRGIAGPVAVPPRGTVGPAGVGAGAPGSGGVAVARPVQRAEILPPGYDLEAYLARNGDRLAAVDRRPPPPPSAGERQVSKVAAESYVRWKTNWDRDRGVIGSNQFYRLPVAGEIGDPSFWSVADDPAGVKRLRVVLVTEGRMERRVQEVADDGGVRDAILSAVGEGLRFLLDERPDGPGMVDAGGRRFVLSP